MALFSKRPNTPKKLTWIVGLICGIAGIIGHYTIEIKMLTEYNYPLLLIGFLALAAGTTFRDL